MLDNMKQNLDDVVMQRATTLGADVFTPEIPFPDTEAMLAGLDLVLEAEAAISNSPTSSEIMDSVLNAGPIDEIQVLLREPNIIERASGALTASTRARRHLVAGVVARHFGFEGTASHHFDQLEDSPYERFLSSYSHEKDNQLERLVNSEIDSFYSPAMKRALASEIQNPFMAALAYEPLYINGDDQSFNPYFDCLVRCTNELLQSAQTHGTDQQPISRLIERLRDMYFTLKASEPKLPIEEYRSRLDRTQRLVLIVLNCFTNSAVGQKV